MSDERRPKWKQRVCPTSGKSAHYHRGDWIYFECGCRTTHSDPTLYVHSTHCQLAASQAENEASHERERVLREALEWYADEDNYEVDPPCHDEWGHDLDAHVVPGTGDRARRALKGDTDGR